MDGKAPLDNTFPEAFCVVCGRRTNQGITIPESDLEEVKRKVELAKQSWTNAPKKRQKEKSS